MLNRFLHIIFLLSLSSLVYGQCPVASDYELEVVPAVGSNYDITLKRADGLGDYYTSLTIVDDNGFSYTSGAGAPIPATQTASYDDCSDYVITATFTVRCKNTTGPNGDGTTTLTLNYNLSTGGGSDVITATATSCGSYNISTTASGTGLLWSFGDGTYQTDDNMTSHTYTSNGVYVITVSDPDDPSFCSEYKQVTVTGLPEGEISALTSCVANTVLLSSSGSVSDTYSWNLGDGSAIQTGQSLPIYTYSSAGTYLVTLTITDGSGCSSVETKVIEVGAPAINYLIADLCETEIFTPIWVPGWGTTYSWVLGDGSTSSLQYPAHTYSVTTGSSETFTQTLTITNAEGCVSTQSQNITVSKMPTLSISTSPEACNNLSHNFTPTATDVSSLNWHIEGFDIPGTSGTTLNHLFASSGLKDIVLEGINGACSTSETIQINVNPALSISLSGGPTLCSGSSLTLNSTVTGGSGSYTYSWLKLGLEVGTSSSLSITTGGVYTLKVSEVGCPGYESETITITEQETPEVTSLDITGTNCPGTSSGSVEFTLSSVPAEGYSINAGPVQMSSPYTLSGLSEGVHYFTVSNGDNASCASIASATISYEGATVGVDATPVSCVSGGNLTASLADNPDGANITSVAWYLMGDPSVQSTANPYTGAPSGMYTAVVTIDNPSGCEITSSLVTLSSPSLNVVTENTYVCTGGGTTTVTATASMSTGITGSYTYNWENATPATVSTGVTADLPAGTYTLTVTESTTGCSTIKTVNVEEISPLSLSPSHTVIGCIMNGSVSIYATGGSSNFQYEWTIPAGTIDPYTGPGLTDLTAAGNYTVEVTDVDYGCTASETINLTVAPPITSVTITPDPCGGTVNVVGGTPTYVYQWLQDGDVVAVSGSNVQSGLEPGDYTVNVVDANGCEKSALYTITEPISTLDITFKFTFGPKEYEEEIVETDYDEALFEAMSDASDHLMDALSDCVIEQDKTIKTEFKTACLNLDNFRDRLGLRLKLKQQQYTLFYHDRAGNLTKTVPPEGVDFLSSTEIAQISAYRSETIGGPLFIAPNHRLESKYDHNSIGGLITQETPDGGMTKFIYDDLKRLRFSQTARQAVAGTYSYTKFDELSRPTESGESSEAGLNFSNLLLPTNVTSSNNPSFPSTGIEVMYTIYSDPSAVSYYGEGQSYTQNRVSYTVKDEDGNLASTGDQYKSHYSYDVHGNVKWLIQEDPMIGKNYVAYEYDLVSGNVKQVKYNEKRADKFFHRYSYDADNRLVKAETSRDEVIWDEDASYDYYVHGPLRREEIGEDDIQGIDYTYTIQGWLKGINNGDNTITKDPNQDGNNSFQQDAFGMSLGYFEGDFARGGGIFNDVNLYESDVLAAGLPANKDLYNGNISSWSSHTNTGIASESKTNISTYRYDDLQRIKSSTYLTNNAGIGIAYSQLPGKIDNYKTEYDYDRNGNLHNLKRHDETGNLLDNISYSYNKHGGTTANKESNQLSSVTDAVVAAGPSGLYDTHIYTYDASGNLTKDYGKEYLDGAVHTVNLDISWTVRGKVNQIIKAISGPSINRTEHINFHYDAMGVRVGKDHIQDISEPELTNFTRYVTDAGGNVMGIYKIDVSEDLGTYTAALSLIEHPIYGSSRIGLDNQEVPLQTWTFTGGGAPTYFYDEDGTETIAELSNWIMSSIKSTTVGSTETTELCECEIKQTAFVESTPGDYDYTEGGIIGTFYGKIENGLSVGETTQGDKKVYAVLVDNYLGTTDQCLVLNMDG